MTNAKSLAREYMTGPRNPKIDAALLGFEGDLEDFLAEVIQDIMDRSK